jgi:hypothetical protein
MINRQPAKEGLVTATDFPLKVVCPECHSAIGNRCSYNSRPLDKNGFIATHNETIYVAWFHFSRVELAKETTQ